MSAKAKITFKRKLYDRMLQWKQLRAGSTALLIQGARRIGKSTLAEEFAQREYKSYILIDFAFAPKSVHDLFKDMSDLNYIFLQLQLIYGVKLYERASVIIFDEVQKQPLARQAIKMLVKDKRYDYIETGSLMSVYKSSSDILIPSEETKLDMYPMDYEEFRWALGDHATTELLRQAFEQKTPLGDAVHRQMMRDFRLYMLVGGMPQAVAAYIQTNNLAAVDLVKRDLVTLYIEDMNKIDPTGKAARLYQHIPAQLSKNAVRYQAREVLGDSVADTTANIVRLMASSMTTNVCYHSNDPNAGLALTIDDARFKLYTSDTGMFVTLAFMDKSFTDNVIYQKLLTDKLGSNLGYLYENMVAQMLHATGKMLYYHTIPYHDRKKYYEVDFVLADGFKVSPIEVKSSGYKAHASLDAFSQKYSDRIVHKYLLYTKDQQRVGDIQLLPIYMTMFL
ncbi:MAG: ATP-binding protein [Bacteroidaceae bacterium]|nr:ATP-binding protein [Bacteroidaceae bacterium]